MGRNVEMMKRKMPTVCTVLGHRNSAYLVLTGVNQGGETSRESLYRYIDVLNFISNLILRLLVAIASRRFERLLVTMHVGEALEYFSPSRYVELFTSYDAVIFKSFL